MHHPETFSRRGLFWAAWAALAGGYLASRSAGQSKQGMIVRSAHPDDQEMRLDGFDNWITPVERFFVRSHHYTPPVELPTWRLVVAGEVERPLTFTLEELRKLPRAEVVSVLECAGNGRAFFGPRVAGLQWAHGAVGNARWGGVRLADVLRQAGLKSAAREILFDGEDVPMGTMPEFRRSLPVEKAQDPNTLLAYEMNGQPLSPAHGFPLRVVAPGWAGDSWVKWVKEIRVLDREYDGFFMATAYRIPVRPVAPGSAVDPAQMRPVTELRPKSVIAAPVHGSRLAPGPVQVRGAAWSGETPLAAVEISVDRGRTWRAAKLGADQSRYAWRLWEAVWNPQPGYHVLMARARDAAGQAQPLVQEWNPSGYLWNVVQQVGVEVSPDPGSGYALETLETAPAALAPPAGYRAACLACHEEDVIVQQRLTRAQWERETEKMIRWGARLSPRLRQEIIDYLSARYGPAGIR